MGMTSPVGLLGLQMIMAVIGLPLASALADSALSCSLKLT